MINYKSKDNIVLVGSGYWGTNIAKNLIKLNIKKFTIFDTDKKKSLILKKRFPDNILIGENLDALLKDNKKKFFFFATPPSKNLRLLQKVLKYDKKIFLEKPGLKNFKEIQKIKKQFPKKIKNITFGYIYMFNNYIKFIKKFIKNKKNGRILYLKFQRQNLGPIRNDVDVSYDLSSHDISILLYFFKNKINLKNSYSYNILKKNIADISHLSFKVKNFYADINNSWLNPDKIRRLIVITSKKMLLFNEMSKENKIRIYDKYATYPKIEKLKNTFFSKEAKIYEGANYAPKIIDNDPLYDEIKHFLINKKNNYNKYININFASNVLRLLSKIKN